MERGKIYEYAIVHHPTRTKEDIEAGVVKPSVLIVPPTYIIANNDEQAKMVAARAIPESYLDKLSTVEVAVRPF